VDLPNREERHQIFAIQLTRRKQDPGEPVLARLADATPGYSGAEIDAVVETAMYACYSGRQPMTTQTLLDAIAQTVPLSTTRAEEIQQLRAWAKTRAVPASVPDANSERA
jgi:SpoVK/Ycf46/Vps4 family AAA+-type ATPase